MPTGSPAVAHKRARVMALKRHHPNGSKAVDDAVLDLREQMLTEHIQREVAKAPPLTDDQKARLAALLRPCGSDMG
jgi:hypothetical protein